MSGGSRESEGPDDFQCDSCGLWYNRLGLDQHKAGCRHPEWADPIVPLVDVDDHPMMGGAEDVEDVEETDDVDDVAPTPDADAPQTAMTDGGNPAFGAPEAMPRADGSGSEDADDDGEPECPNCGGSRWFDPAEAAPDGHALATYDYGCAGCSTEESWEVWNA